MATYNIATQLVIQGVDTASLTKAMGKITGEMNKATTQAKSFADAVALRGVNLAGYTVIGAAVVKMTEAISRATNDAIRFEYEMAKIAQTVQQSNAAVNKHAESIREISVVYGLSAPKIAETIRVLAQAGYSFKEAKASADSLAQTTLLASFESIADTTDGLIAINKQFKETMGDSARVLAVLNTVSKKYAVESSDLVEAVRKAGGTFAATGGKMEELVTIFTTVRDTTRESSETIATGLRTIFSRLQRPKTIDYLRGIGIELTDLRGNFVGNYEAIIAIQKGLAKAQIAPKSIKFAEVVEEIGGIRQQSRVIPLLIEAAKMQKIYADTQAAASDTALDLAKAQDTLSFKLSQTQQIFSRFIGDIAGSENFKVLVSGFLSVTNAVINFASSLKDLIPLITSLLAFKLGASLGKIAIKSPAAAILGVGGGRGFARGGFVPGSGSGDTVPAMLTPGEFVINKKSSQAIGYGALQRANKYAAGGVVQHFAGGGGVSDVNFVQTLGGGLDALILQFNSLSPSISSVAGAFAGLSIQLSLASQLGKGLGNAFVSVRKSFQDEATARAKLVLDIAEQQTKVDAANTAVISSMKGYSDAVADRARNTGPGAAPQGVRARIFNAGTAGIASGRNVARGTNEEELAATGPLQKEITAFTAQVKASTLSSAQQKAVTDQLSNVLVATKDSVRAQLQGFRTFKDSLKNTAEGYDSLVASAEVLTEINAKVAEAEEAKLRELKAQSGGRFSRGLKKAGAVIGEVGPQVVAGVLAVFTANLNEAAKAAEILSTKAIEAGDAITAREESLKASAEAEAASATQSGAAAGLSIGVVIGTIFPPLLAIAPVVGTLLGALIGFTGGLTAVTDFLGFTSSKLDAEKKAKEAELAANISGNTSLADKTLKRSADLRKDDPDLANKVLAESIDGFIRDLDARNLGEFNPEARENIKKTSDALSDAILEKAKRPENEGKSFEQLQREDDGLIAGVTALSNEFNEGAFKLKALKETVDANAAVIQAEKEVRLESIAAQIAQIEQYNQLSATFTKLETSLESQVNTLNGFNFIKTGELSRNVNTDVTETNSQNINSPKFANALDRVSKLSPAFKAQTESFKKSINTFDDKFIRLIGDRTESPVNSNSVEMDRLIEETLKSSGLASDIQSDIFNELQKGISDKKNPLQAISDVINKYVAPTGEKLQQANASIEKALTQQIDINKEIINAEKSRLEASITASQDQAKIQKNLRDAVANQFDPGLVSLNEFGIANNNRTSTAKQALQGTALEQSILTGKKEDLTLIFKKLRANKIEQAAIQDQINLHDTQSEEGQKLAESQKSLRIESDKFESALSILSDTTAETAALQNKLSESLERRAKIKNEVQSFAFGTAESRIEQFITANQAASVAKSGSLNAIPDADKANVVSFLEKFKNDVLPGLGGKTGGDVLNRALANDLKSLGFSSVFIEDTLARLTAEEEKMLKEIEDRAQLDVTRNGILEEIRDTLTTMLVRGNTLPAVAGNAKGGIIKYASNGMFVPKGTDTVPAMLTPGEFVIKKSAVQSIGLANLQALNNGTNYLAQGGLAEKRKRAEIDLERAKERLRQNDKSDRFSPRKQAIEEKKRLSAERRLASYNRQEEKEKREEQRRTESRDTVARKSLLPRNLAPTNPAVAAYRNARSDAAFTTLTNNREDQAVRRTTAASKSEEIFNANKIDQGKRRAAKAESSRKIFEQNKAAQIIRRGGTPTPIALGSDGRPAGENKVAVPAPITALLPTKSPDSADQRSADRSASVDKILNEIGDAGLEREFARIDKAKADAKVNAFKPASILDAGYSVGTLAESESFTTPKADTRTDFQKEFSGFNNRVAIGRGKALVDKQNADTRASIAANDAAGDDPFNFKDKKTYNSIKEPEYASKLALFLFGQRKKNFATGGPVGTDTVPAMLTPGEFVLRKSAAKAIGSGRLNALNKGQTGYFHEGGPVGHTHESGGSDQVGVSVSQLEMFSKQFDASVQKLVEMPKVFEISLASQGVNVNLNGAEFLSKLPDLMRSIILDRIQEEIGHISDAVKKNLSAGL